MSAQPKRFVPELTKGLFRENPTFVQVLGMCPPLAITNSVMNGIVMGIATTFVLVMSSMMISALRRVIPSQVRISTYVVVIATFVTVADFTLQASAQVLFAGLVGATSGVLAKAVGYVPLFLIAGTLGLAALGLLRAGIPAPESRPAAP